MQQKDHCPRTVAARRGRTREPRSLVRILGWVGCLLPFVFVSACAGEDDKVTTTSATNDPTFTNITKTVITASRCSGPLCHSRADVSGFSLGTKTTLYNELVGVAAAGPKCKSSGLIRVVPGEPDQSLLYMKITGKGPEGGPLCGDTMPVNGSLTSDQMDLIRRWILAGAPND